MPFFTIKASLINFIFRAQGLYNTMIIEHYVKQEKNKGM